MREDQQAVKDDIQPAHGRVQDACRPHIAAALEHAPGQLTHLNSWDGAGINEEIAGRICLDLRIASQPHGQAAADGDAQRRENAAEQQSDHQRLPQHPSGRFRIPAANQMRHLNGKAVGHGDAQTAQQPC